MAVRGCGAVGATLGTSGAECIDASAACVAVGAACGGMAVVADCVLMLGGMAE